MLSSSGMVTSLSVAFELAAQPENPSNEMMAEINHWAVLDSLAFIVVECYYNVGWWGYSLSSSVTFSVITISMFSYLFTPIYQLSPFLLPSSNVGLIVSLTS